MSFTEDVVSLAVELERCVTEATKRAAIRSSEGRRISRTLRGHLERSYVALGQLLEIDDEAGRTPADRRHELEAMLDRLAGEK